MADPLLEQTMEIPQTDLTVPDMGITVPDFNIIIPKPFNLADQSKSDLDKIRDECMDKVRTWEKRMSDFFNEYIVYTESWRVKPRERISKKPTGLFNSKSAETHRAVETRATFWLRSLTASDPFFEAVAEGLDQNGEEVTEENIYAAERVLVKQLQASHFKSKLYRSLNSVALFGSCVVEEPFVKRGGVEYTDFVFRSMLKTAFNCSVMDMELSDFIATIDFPTKWMLTAMAKSGGEYWNLDEVKRIIKESANVSSTNLNTNTNVFNRLQESKQRAGYVSSDPDIYEFINYHGRIETENPVIQALWESEERQDNPEDVDFSIGILNGQTPIKLHVEQYGDWHTRFKIAHDCLFEDEPLGYGVGRIGRKSQREQDIIISRVNDLILMGVYSMWKVGKYAGLKSQQLNISPNAMIELEDVTQMERLGIDLNAIQMAINALAMMREDFRTSVGAQSNLQAQLTKASATESAIAQNEAVRGISVHAEMIAETFLREHIEQSHVNNLNYLDVPIWVQSTGTQKPMFYNKENLPANVGFLIKIVLDKDFRPERILRLREALDITTSIRNIVPQSINAVVPLFEEYFRSMGMNPRLLNRPKPMNQQLEEQMQRAQRMGQNPQLMNENAGEVASEQAGAGEENNTIGTPMGQISASSNQPLIGGL